MTIHKVGNKQGKSLRSGLNVGSRIVSPNSDTVQTSKLRKGLGQNAVEIVGYWGIPPVPEPWRALWTPAEITTSLWLDSATTDSVILSSGKVSQWLDLSGNENHAIQVTDSLRPIYEDLTVKFTGSQYLIISHDTTLNLASSGSVAIVYQATGGFRIFQKKNGFGNEIDAYFYADSTAIGISAAIATGVQDDVNIPFVESSVWNGANVAMYRDGDLIPIASTLGGTISGGVLVPANTAAQNNSDPLYIGARNNNGAIQGFMIGNIQELIISQSAWSLSTKQKIEGYLAHKRGETARLASGHPYKASPPFL